MNDEYRSRIYEKYAANFQDNAAYSTRRPPRLGKAYRTYLKGWLPGDKERPWWMSRAAAASCFFLQADGYLKVRGIEISPDQAALARQVLPDVVQEDVLSFLERHGTHST